MVNVIYGAETILPIAVQVVDGGKNIINDNMFWNQLVRSRKRIASRIASFIGAVVASKISANTLQRTRSLDAAIFQIANVKAHKVL